MKKLTVAQNDTWHKQAKADAIAWHVARRALSADENTPMHFGYNMGFSAGWQECLKALKLHGYIQM